MSAELPIRSAQVVVRCDDLAATLAFLTARLGFRVDLVMPADAPSTVVVSAHGVALRLEATTRDDAPVAPMTLRLACELAALPAHVAHELVGPGGLRVVLADAHPPVNVPDGRPEFVLTRMGGAGAWGAGRAGMQYRDLIPGRLGGRFVASHIRIPDGGDVPDYVHFHRVRFQMICCVAGWVRVVYEDQGPPFTMHAGDCVLQPPEIRHRVLEASQGLEVIEIGCPAVHETIADHALPLPTAELRPARAFGGQRFVRHVAADAAWGPSTMPGFEARDTGIAAATNGMADVRVVRALASGASERTASVQLTAASELQFLFVLGGELALLGAELGDHALRAGDACVVPAGSTCGLRAGPPSEWLEVRLPA